MAVQYCERGLRTLLSLFAPLFPKFDLIVIPKSTSGRSEEKAMRTALLTAVALVAFSSLAIAQDQLVATEPASKAKIPKVQVNDPNGPGGRLHYDLPCRVSPEGTCISAPPLHRPKP